MRAVYEPKICKVQAALFEQLEILQGRMEDLALLVSLLAIRTACRHRFLRPCHQATYEIHVNNLDIS